MSRGADTSHPLGAGMPFVPFVDVMGVNSLKIPAVPSLGVIALYATGSDGIQATAAEVARFRDAGVGIILIDQTPTLSVFAAGWADVADVESGAGTYATASWAVQQRQKHGWDSCIYLSQSAIAAQEAAFPASVDRAKVFYGVANWNDSQAAAEAAMEASPRWAYVQYGDPNSNPNTLVPGTSLTLSQAGADIDVAQESFAGQFVPRPPAPPPPPPAPPGPPKEGKGYLWTADGSKSLAQFAAERGATVAGIVQVTLESLDPAQREAFNGYLTEGLGQPMPKDLPFCTANP